MKEQDNLKKFFEKMSNPCKDDEHDYEPMVAGMGKATMVHQICKKCFDMRGWIYDWQKED
jgi:sulfur relay (sulfurtransferase) complex TusBCD TusD component (DsrE family)